MVSNGKDHLIRTDEHGNILGDTVMLYTHDFKRTTIGLEFKYNFNRSLLFAAYMPLSFYSLNEKYFRDFYGVRYTMADLSKTRLDYLELAGRYNITKEKIISGLIAMVRIPSGFEKGQYHFVEGDSTKGRPFLSDGAFEFLAGTNFGFRAEKISWENDVLFNYRAEDFRNQLLVNSKFSFSSVPNTKLSILALTKVAFANFDNARPIVPGEEILQENSFAAGAEFEFLFSEEMIGKINYNVTLLGRNTWNGGIFNIYLGFRF
jgi:hypothetical protein